MENIFPQELIDLLIVSVSFSMILMVFIQKCKRMKFINQKWHLCALNFVLSFALGIPFAMTFYHISFENAVWVGVFTFIGAPSIYDTLKNQTILSYKPVSLNQTISIPIENEIKTTVGE